MLAINVNQLEPGLKDWRSRDMEMEMNSSEFEELHEESTAASTTAVESVLSLSKLDCKTHNKTQRIGAVCVGCDGFLDQPGAASQNSRYVSSYAP